MADEILAVSVLSGVFGIAGVIVGIIASNQYEENRAKAREVDLIAYLASGLTRDILGWLVHVAKHEEELAGISEESWPKESPPSKEWVISRVTTALRAFPFPDIPARQEERTVYAGVYAMARELLQDYASEANDAAKDLRGSPGPTPDNVARFLVAARHVATADMLIGYAGELFDSTVEVMASIYDRKVDGKRKAEEKEKFMKELRKQYALRAGLTRSLEEQKAAYERMLSKFVWTSGT